MKTKPPAARIAAFVAIAMAIPTLLMFAEIHHVRKTSLAVAAVPAGVAAGLGAPNAAPLKRDWTNAYGELPLAFEPNQGQTAPDVRFLAHGQGYQLFLTTEGAVLTLRHPLAASTKAAKGAALFAARRKKNCR